MPLLESLMDALMKTGSDFVRLRAEQRIYMLHQGVRREIGRDVISSDRIEKIASDMLGPETASKLDHRPHAIVMQRSGKSFKIVFRRISHVLGIEIQPATEAEAVETKPRTAPKKPPPPPKESPAPISVGERAPDTDHEEPAINELLRLMISENASDIHLSAGARPVLRVDGDIRFLNDHEPMDASLIASTVREIVPEDTFKQFEQDSDADFAYEIPGLARFRINVFTDRNGIGVVIRQIPFGIRSAEEIGLQKSVLDLCYLTKGLVLVTGPTGAGKSTTLASLIDHINKNRSGHIITIEDPIEFVHENINCHINQREIGAHTRSFKHGLRAALREDPDVVLVGEMRDLETISIAIEMAETGHLVFGTLHTSTSVSTIDRIIDQYPANQQSQVRVMLSECLKGIIAQVLCKRTGGGRIAAFEILLDSPAVSSLIREGKTFQLPSVMQTSKRMGMLTMNESLFTLVKNGLIDPKEGLLQATDKDALATMYKNAGISFEMS